MVDLTSKARLEEEEKSREVGGHKIERKRKSSASALDYFGYSPSWQANRGVCPDGRS